MEIAGTGEMTSKLKTNEAAARRNGKRKTETEVADAMLSASSEADRFAAERDMSATRQIRIVKVGGAQLASAEQIDELCEYVRELRDADQSVVVVHGGGGEIGELHTKLGIPFEKKEGLRTTSRRSMDIVTMVLCGLVNKRIVARMLATDLPAVGLSGVDGGFLASDFVDRDRLGQVGGSPQVSPRIIETLLKDGVIPIIAPVSLSNEGGLLNVNADVAAQAISVALGASSLEFVTDVDGLKTENGVERRVEPAKLRKLLASEVITGGMIPKVQAAMAAISGGVDRVRIGSYQALGRGNATEVHA